ncbi:uncharacterized protein ASPGLDRAFT_1501590 [Aspergillus glaucus CBS 516.65]|uniref:N-acetyltransferase domain-containing protein n=1 Tax=Aspergillus glaucus CBS 516.65 TaxID=1160497 RepID=A0A1L9V9Y2_ASPGL|nr:hypothetical protein ASPGLDRAFT_1501590 [Aspergillus glaucus CBS 516.65]OJJ80737.1 hypothetical protein ASPGLDRAFT_1501590 [Aspergillus glaucus CBS 516.65]
MCKQVLYEIFAGHQITEGMLDEAAKLFSEHYGIWGEHSHNPVTADGKFAGNVFACRWEHDHKIICWVTQLLVHKNYRQRGLATDILACLKSNKISDSYGIMSSHPASIMATASSFGFTIDGIDLDFVRINAKGIIRALPIPSVRDAKLRGLLFEEFDASTGLVCGAGTNFFVDHKEPEETLNSIPRTRKWYFGKLPEGHEYLLILKGRPR